MITNATKPTTTLVNATRIPSFETWDSIPTTWASETRTWDDQNLIDNTPRQSSAITNQVKPA